MTGRPRGVCVSGDENGDAAAGPTRVDGRGAIGDVGSKRCSERPWIGKRTETMTPANWGLGSM